MNCARCSGSVAAFIAGVGGALLVMVQSPFVPASTFPTFEGLVWLAVLVTIGVRSNAAALIAGIVFVFPAALFQNYLPSWTWTTEALSVLFGLGAISAAKFPDGSLAENSRQLRRLVLRLRPPAGVSESELDATTALAADASSGNGAPRGAEHVS